MGEISFFTVIKIVSILSEYCQLIYVFSKTFGCTLVVKKLLKFIHDVHYHGVVGVTYRDCSFDSPVNANGCMSAMAFPFKNLKDKQKF